MYRRHTRGIRLPPRSEVDDVVSDGRRTLAIEVASRRQTDRVTGLAAFVARFPGSRPLLIWRPGPPLAEALSRSAGELLD